MAEWWSIEIFHGDREPATRWRDSYEDALIEAALTSGALYWEWGACDYGVIFEVCFSGEAQWTAFRDLPAVKSALDSVPDPVNGLLIYPGRGGAAGGRVPRKPRPTPGAAALELDEPPPRRRFRLRSSDPDSRPPGDGRAMEPAIPDTVLVIGPDSQSASRG